MSMPPQSSPYLFSSSPNHQMALPSPGDGTPAQYSQSRASTTLFSQEILGLQFRLPSGHINTTINVNGFPPSHYTYTIQFQDSQDIRNSWNLQMTYHDFHSIGFQASRPPPRVISHTLCLYNQGNDHKFWTISPLYNLDSLPQIPFWYCLWILDNRMVCQTLNHLSDHKKPLGVPICLHLHLVNHVHRVGLLSTLEGPTVFRRNMMKVFLTLVCLFF